MGDKAAAGIGQGKEDSELEKSPMMTDEEMEIWAKEKDVQAEAIDGKVWGIQDRFPTGRSRSTAQDTQTMV